MVDTLRFWSDIANNGDRAYVARQRWAHGFALAKSGLFEPWTLRRLTGLLGSIPEGVPLFLEPRSRASGSYDDFCDLRSLAVKQLWARWTVRSET